MHDITRVETAFDRDALRRICVMPEHEFGQAFDMQRFAIDQPAPEDYYFFRDHGSSILAVAHLDTVGASDERECNFVDTAGGEVVYSRALDDRLGAYTILDWLPRMGIQHDILLTVGEESGLSTAAGFDVPPGKSYDWIIEFDRGGTDVVMYQYDDHDTRAAVRRSGARVGDGSFSDIAYLEHVGVKAFNWGVGYRDYHGPRAHAYLDDTFQMLAYYLRFHSQNKGVAMPHEIDLSGKSSWWGGGYTFDDTDEEYDADGFYIGPDAERMEAEIAEAVYFDREYVENPTPEQIRRAAEIEQSRLWQ